MKHSHNFSMITPKDIHLWLDENKPFYLIDTLPGDHFRRVHLPHARNACVYEVTFLAQIAQITRDTSATLVLYGSSANSLDAHTAAEKLIMAGYADVSIMEGGIENWRQQGYTLEGESPKEADDPDTHLQLENGRYTVDLDESRIGWTGRNPNTRHCGTVNLSSGTIEVSDTAIQGAIGLDMDSIRNINLAGDELQPILVSHLKSDDFFFVDAFPAARFDIRNGRIFREPYLTLPNCELTGTLDLRGVQNDLTFQATAATTPEGSLHLTANFDLDRTFWGITYGSSRFYEHLGMHKVFDLISIELQIIARKAVVAAR